MSDPITNQAEIRATLERDQEADDAAGGLPCQELSAWPEQLYLVMSGGDYFRSTIVPESKLDEEYLLRQWIQVVPNDEEQAEALEHFHDDDCWTHAEVTGHGDRLKFQLSHEDGWIEVVRLPNNARAALSAQGGEAARRFPLHRSDESATPKQAWEFWKPIITNANRTINYEQLELELCDAYNFMQFGAIVYDYATGGKCTKVNTLPSVVKSLIDDHVTALREQEREDAAEAQSQQEPAASMHVADVENGLLVDWRIPRDFTGKLYTSPPPPALAQEELVPLTWEKIEDLWAGVSMDRDDGINIEELARAIERAHGIKPPKE